MADLVTAAAATTLLRSGSVLVLTHGSFGDAYWIEPGGPVAVSAVRRIFDALPLEDNGDALVKGEISQTWKLPG